MQYRENVQYKAKEREEFFRRLDRGGTIRAVAAELGLSVDACYRWRQEANVGLLATLLWLLSVFRPGWPPAQ